MEAVAVCIMKDHVAKCSCWVDYLFRTERLQVTYVSRVYSEEERAHMVNRIGVICKDYNFQELTLGTAVRVMDRYMTSNVVDCHRNPQLVSTVSLLIASKYHENAQNCLNLTDVLEYCTHTTKELIMQTERLMFSALDYNLRKAITPFAFLFIFRYIWTFQDQ